MKYGSLEFDTQFGSTTITHVNRKKIIHIPFSDKNETVEEGREATTINTTILTYSESVKDQILALLHSNQSAELTIGLKKYKKVISSNTFTAQGVTRDKVDYWTIGAEFVALDPIPYDAETGEALYA